MEKHWTWVLLATVTPSSLILLSVSCGPSSYDVHAYLQTERDLLAFGIGIPANGVGSKNDGSSKKGGRFGEVPTVIARVGCEICACCLYARRSFQQVDGAMYGATGHLFKHDFTVHFSMKYVHTPSLSTVKLESREGPHVPTPM